MTVTDNQRSDAVRLLEGLVKEYLSFINREDSRLYEEYQQSTYLNSIDIYHAITLGELNLKKKPPTSGMCMEDFFDLKELRANKKRFGWDGERPSLTGPGRGFQKLGFCLTMYFKSSIPKMNKLVEEHARVKELILLSPAPNLLDLMGNFRNFCDKVTEAKDG